MFALEGIKVLDLTRLLPGPYCTMVLADMGADVIKIEPVKPFRLEAQFPKPPALSLEQWKQILMAYRFVDRNRKSLALDLKKNEARQIFYQLVKDSDVVVEELRPGATKRLGIDYDSLKDINPLIIYCAISGYGQDGPYRLVAGHDSNFLGVAGVIRTTICPMDGSFVRSSLQIADLAGGLHGVVGILCALLARKRLGKGQFVDISITDCVANWLLLSPCGLAYFTRGKQPKQGDKLTLIYQTKDEKYITLSPTETHFWEKLCRAIGLDEYIPYHAEVLEAMMPQGLKISKKKQKEINMRFAEVFRTRTRDEWLQILWQADASIGPANTIQEMITDPQLVHRKVVIDMEHPTLGKVKQIGNPIKLSDALSGFRYFPPSHGQHTEEILLKSGYDKDEIRKLDRKGVIHTMPPGST